MTQDRDTTHTFLNHMIRCDAGDLLGVLKQHLTPNCVFHLSHPLGTLVAVKAPKDYRIDIGQSVSIAIPTTTCHLFNVKTGARLSA